jgi:hypothetical protein
VGYSVTLDELFPNVAAKVKAALASNADQYGEGLTYKPHHEELRKALGHLNQSLINNDNSEDETTHRISALIRLLKVAELDHDSSR